MHDFREVSLDPRGVAPELRFRLEHQIEFNDPTTMPDLVFTTKVACSIVPMAELVVDIGSQTLWAATAGGTEEVMAVHVYTDGTEQAWQAAWDVAAVLELRGGGFAMIGHFGGRVGTKEQHERYVGPPLCRHLQRNFMPSYGRVCD